MTDESPRLKVATATEHMIYGKSDTLSHPYYEHLLSTLLSRISLNYHDT